MNIQRQTQLIGHKAAIYKLLSYQNPMGFLSVGGDGWVAAWDLEQGEDGQLIAQVDGTIFSVHYLDAYHQLVLGDMTGLVYWVDLVQKTTLKSVKAHKKGVFDLHEVSNKIWSLGGDGNIGIWNKNTMQLEATWDISNQALRTLTKHPTMPIVAVGSSDNSIYIIQTETMTILQQIEEAHDNSVFTLCFDAQGQYLWSGGRDAQIIIRSVKENYAIHHKIPAHLFTVNDLKYSPNQRWVASASRDKSIKIWDSQTFQLLKVIDYEKYGGHLNSVNHIYWIDNQQLISAGDDRSLIHWRIEA